MLKTRIFTFLKILFTILLLIGAQRFCHLKTDGFAVAKISSNLPFHQEWEGTPLSIAEQEQIRSILDQEFTYLAKGAQCFVFESSDKKYVLKFFRHSHMRAPLPISYLSKIPVVKSSCQKLIHKRENKLYKDFASYKIAFDELKEQTGLVYIHLNKTDHLQKNIKIIDKIGIAHVLDLDNMEFLLQKKAALLYPALEALIAKHDKERVKAVLSELVSLLVLRAQKGIDDKDPDLNTNFGLIDQRPIQIDIGRFKKPAHPKTQVAYQQEIVRITDHLQQWLEARDVELSTYLQQQTHAL